MGGASYLLDGDCCGDCMDLRGGSFWRDQTNGAVWVFGFFGMSDILAVETSSTTNEGMQVQSCVVGGQDFELKNVDCFVLRDWCVECRKIVLFSY